MRKMRKRILSVLLTAVAATTLLAGCGGKDEGKKAAGEDITVVSREDGSGTRGAFIELFGIEEKDSDGRKRCSCSHQQRQRSFESARQIQRQHEAPQNPKGHDEMKDGKSHE